MIAITEKQENQNMMTIGQVARSIGVPATTLRYYEREALLTPTARNAAGYRFYDPQAIQRLEFIRSAQSVGFSLDDIKALLSLDQRTSCKQVQHLIEERLSDVTKRIRELRSVEKTLNAALDRCKRSRKGCPVLGDLRGSKNSRSRGITNSEIALK